MLNSRSAARQRSDRLCRPPDRAVLQPPSAVSSDVAAVVLTLLPDTRKREFIIDRTNWKLGTADVNALVLAVLWRGIAIPLFFELLPHGGSSGTEIRLALLDDVLCLLSCQEIAVLSADREFIGQAWIQGLARAGIPI